MYVENWLLLKTNDIRLLFHGIFPINAEWFMSKLLQTMHIKHKNARNYWRVSLCSNLKLMNVYFFSPPLPHPEVFDIYNGKFTQSNYWMMSIKSNCIYQIYMVAAMTFKSKSNDLYHKIVCFYFPLNDNR